MIRLTVKGRQPDVELELKRRNIAPFAIVEVKSQFVPDFYTCDVAVISAHRPALSLWFEEGEEYIGKGEGFPVGTLMYYSTPKGDDVFFDNKGIDFKEEK